MCTVAILAQDVCVCDQSSYSLLGVLRLESSEAFLNFAFVHQLRHRHQRWISARRNMAEQMESAILLTWTEQLQARIIGAEAQITAMEQQQQTQIAAMEQQQQTRITRMEQQQRQRIMRMESQQADRIKRMEQQQKRQNLQQEELLEQMAARKCEVCLHHIERISSRINDLQRRLEATIETFTSQIDALKFDLMESNS